MNDVTNTGHGKADVRDSAPMTLIGVRDQIRAFATAKERDGTVRNHYVEMNVLVMDDWWKAIDAHMGKAGEPVAEVVEWKEDDGTTKHCVSFLCPLAEIPLGAKLYPASPSAEITRLQRGWDQAVQELDEATAQPVEAVERVMPYTGLEAASMMRTVIDDMLAQSKGTHETAHQFVSWHLPRVRSLLTDIDAALAHTRPTGDEPCSECNGAGWTSSEPDDAERCVCNPPTVEQAGEVVGFTSEDVSNLRALRRVLENLSKKRAPDPRDLDAEFYVTANINHAVKSAAYWLPIVDDLYMRLYGALAEKARRADDEDAQPRHVGVPDGYRPTDDEVRAWCERHDLADSYIDAWRTAIDDARSMHLIAAAPAPAKAGEA